MITEKMLKFFTVETTTLSPYHVQLYIKCFNQKQPNNGLFSPDNMSKPASEVQYETSHSVFQ